MALAGFGVALLGLVELLRFAAAADPTEFMLDQRLSEPVGYQNGNVALWLMGAFCCLWLAAARQSAPVTRGLALGSASMLASLALLGQSRGSLFALPLALLVFFVIAPGRLRLLAGLLLAGIGVALSAGAVLDVIDAGDASLAAAVDDAARAIVLSALGVALVGALLAAVDRAWRPSASTSKRLTKAGAGLVVAVAVVALVVGATQAGELRGELSERWSEFKSNDDTASGSARLVSGGTNRYDFWTVAWENFEREPLVGVGMDNFQQDYMARGESPEKPRYAHSLELALLSGTGIVGMLLFLGAIIAAAIAAMRLRRGSSPAAAGAQAAALGLFAYWFFHASVDWLYELPALGGLAFAMLGLACGIRVGGSEPAAERRVAQVIPAVLAGAAALSFAFPWLAEREVAKASAGWRSAPAAAYERLDRAAGLNPTSVQADLFEGTIAVQRGELGRAERAFLEVVEREPRNSYAWLDLAALASARQGGELARRRLARASELNPTDEATREARRTVRDGRRILPKQVLRDVLKYARGGTE